MKRYEAIEIITQALRGGELIMSSTGMISRELFTIKDSPQNFYLLGSMGLASSVGLGLALCLPDKRVVVLEGDGSILMNLGSMATIGHSAPDNLTQVVLDNQSYDSTGGQPTVSNSVKLDEVARAVGYQMAVKVTSKEALRDSIRKSFKNCPALIIVEVEKGGIEGIGRVSHTPEEIKDRFLGRSEKAI